MKVENITIDSNYRTQHDSVIIVSKKGEIKNHQVIKNGEEIIIKRKSKNISSPQLEALKNKKDMIEFIQRNEGRFIGY